MCIGCNIISYTRSLHARLKSHVSLYEIKLELLQIFCQFIDWWNIYAINLKVIDDVSVSSRHVASCIELEAHGTSICYELCASHLGLHNVTPTKQSVL